MTAKSELIAMYSQALDAPIVASSELPDVAASGGVDFGGYQWPAPAKRGYLYFARSASDVKIGFSESPIDRVQGLGLGLSLLVSSAGREHEKALHCIFSAERSRRAEYFAGARVERFMAAIRLFASLSVRGSEFGERIGDRLASLSQNQRPQSAVACRVREARLSVGLNRRKLALLAGVSNSYLYQLENDGEGAQIREPRPNTLEKLAKALGVTPEWLAFGKRVA